MDKVTRQCPQTTTFKGEPKQNRTEVLPLSSLTPYRLAKPAHNKSSICRRTLYYQSLSDEDCRVSVCEMFEYARGLYMCFLCFMASSMS